jgi:hypothetical protein
MKISTMTTCIIILIGGMCFAEDSSGKAKKSSHRQAMEKANSSESEFRKLLCGKWESAYYIKGKKYIKSLVVTKQGKIQIVLGGIDDEKRISGQYTIDYDSKRHIENRVIIIIKTKDSKELTLKGAYFGAHNGVMDRSVLLRIKGSPSGVLKKAEVGTVE